MVKWNIIYLVCIAGYCINVSFKGDQIEVFKIIILNGYENIDSNIFFKN